MDSCKYFDVSEKQSFSIKIVVWIVKKNLKIKLMHDNEATGCARMRASLVSILTPLRGELSVKLRHVNSWCLLSTLGWDGEGN